VTVAIKKGHHGTDSFYSEARVRADSSVRSGTLAGLKSHFDQAARERFELPLAACPVSGEYA
jgi:hypothetical protein